jgi:hypothetical protein
MRNTMSRWAMLGVLGFVGLTASDAREVHASSMGLAVAACQKSLAGGTLDLRWDGAYNISTTSGMWLDCSLPASGDEATFYMAQAQLYYTDTSTTDEVGCNFQIRDWDGALIETGAKLKSGVAAAWGKQYFTWTNFAQHDDGMPYFSCWIPAKTAGGAISGVHGMAAAY